MKLYFIHFCILNLEAIFAASEFTQTACTCINPFVHVCVNARARKRCKGKQCNCNCPIVNVVISLIMFPIQLVLLSFCNCNWVWPSAFKLVNSASISYAILLLFVLQLHRFYGIIQAIWNNI